jgi:hypothetical protein
VRELGLVDEEELAKARTLHARKEEPRHYVGSMIIQRTLHRLPVINALQS